MAKTVRVLHVEDNPADARLVREALAGRAAPKFQITHVETFGEADQHVNAGLVDVVLLDLSLPDSPRMRTLASMHTLASSAPIIILTGSEDETLGLWAALEGVHGYLIKGRASPEQLAEAIRVAIGRDKAPPGAGPRPAPAAGATEVTSDV